MNTDWPHFYGICLCQVFSRIRKDKIGTFQDCSINFSGGAVPPLVFSPDPSSPRITAPLQGLVKVPLCLVGFPLKRVPFGFRPWGMRSYSSNFVSETRDNPTYVIGHNRGWSLFRFPLRLFQVTFLVSQEVQKGNW